MNVRDTVRGKKKIGFIGEDLAAEFLLKTGYQIVARNYRALRGEIDIIATKGDVLAFVEVKTNRSNNFGQPETRVTLKKQKQIVKVARVYLQDNPVGKYDLRFDVIAVDLRDRSIEHIENAFWVK